MTVPVRALPHPHHVVEGHEIGLHGWIRGRNAASEGTRDAPADLRGQAKVLTFAFPSARPAN
jgi:hypothetical protein